VWFRRDLRLDDNPAWAAATRVHDRVVALYVLDPGLLDAAGPFRRRQHLAEVHALDRSLGRHGGRLLVRRGGAGTIVAGEARRLGVAGVHWNADVTPFASRRDAAVAADLDVPVTTAWGHLVLPPGSVVTGDGHVPRVFGAFHRRWRATAWDPWPEPGGATLAGDPGDGLPDPEGDPPRPPGPDAALDRLDHFVKHHLDRYRVGRDAAGDPDVSGLSVALPPGRPLAPPGRRGRRHRWARRRGVRAPAGLA
jgi:deoxyribodipyrimidine photo-lyase